MIISKYFFETQILNIHDLNTNLNHLSSRVLSLYCVFDIQNLENGMQHHKYNILFLYKKMHLKWRGH